MKRKLILLMLIVLIAVRPLDQSWAAPDPLQEETATWSLLALAGADTLRLEGYRPTASLSFTVPVGWRPAADGQLTLDYRISDRARADSVLGIRLNGRDLDAASFDETAGTLTLNLLGDLFQPGKNTVELDALLRLEDDDECIVPNHPARWLELGGETRVDLALEPTEGALNLADFPAQFEAPGDGSGTQITFVIPDEPNGGELNALSAVGFALAGESTTRPAWSAVKAGDFNPEQANGPVILIGAGDRNRHLTPLAPADGAEAGWLHLARTEWSRGYPVLAVGGSDGEAVQRAADALADPLATLQMAGETARVETLPDPEPEPPASEITLADLGYDLRTARGTGRQSLIYTVDLPFAWSPEDSELSLHFAHSSLLDPRVSTLTVFLNGRTVSDIRLDAPESPSNVVTLPLQEDLIRPGRNFLRLTFDFGTPIQLCGLRSDEPPWASVRPDTRLILSHGERGARPDLDDFPYLLASEIDLANTTVVLPTDSTTSDFSQALALVRSLSDSDSRRAPRWAHANALALNEELAASHVIVLGEVSRQPAIAAINPHLALPFDLADGRPLPTYGIRVPTERPDLGVIQALRSPQAGDKALLVVTGSSDAGFRQALKFLTEPELQQELEGQLAVTSAGGEEGPQLYTQSVPDIAAVPVVSTLDRIFPQFFGIASPWPAIILLAIGLALLAASIVIGWRWYRRQQARQSSGH